MPMICDLHFVKKLHLDRNTVCIFLVMTLVKLIYRVKCMKEERYAHSTVQYKPSVAATMTVLLQRELDGNARNSYFIVGVIITYLLKSLLIPTPIFSMNELSRITTAQAWQVARIRFIAKVCFEVQKKILERENAFRCCFIRSGSR